MFSHLGWQDGTVCVALITYRFECACESPERLFSIVLDPYKLICMTMLSDEPKWDFLITSLLPYLHWRSSLMKASMLYTPLVRFAYYANILEGLASYPMSASRHFFGIGIFISLNLHIPSRLPFDATLFNLQIRIRLSIILMSFNFWWPKSRKVHVFGSFFCSSFCWVLDVLILLAASWHRHTGS